MNIRILALKFFLAIFLVLQTAPLAFSEELNGFEFTKIIDTETIVPGTNTRFSAFGPPQIEGGKIYFVGWHEYLNKKGKVRLRSGLYMVDKAGLQTIIDYKTQIPGDKKGRNLIQFTSFDVSEGKIVFVASDEERDIEKLYLLEGENLTIIADRNTKSKDVPHIKFKHFSRILFENNIIVFEGGNGPNSSLIIYKEGVFTEVAGKKRKPPGATRKNYIQMELINDFALKGTTLLFSGQIEGKPNLLTDPPGVFEFKDGGLIHLKMPNLENLEGKGFGFIGDLVLRGEGFYFLGINQEGKEYPIGGLGGIYFFDRGTINPIINRHTSLFSDPVFKQKENILDEDFKGLSAWTFKYHSDFFGHRGPSWHYLRSSSISGWENFSVFERKFIKGVFGSDQNIAHSNPLPKKRVSNLANFFLSEVLLAHGNMLQFQGNLLFHARNLLGQEGLFFHSDGENFPLITTQDEVSKFPGDHFFIGSKGAEGGSIVFWTSSKGTEIFEINQAIILAELVVTP